MFGGAVSKDTFSRAWRKVKGDWDVWNARSLKNEPIIRLILDGTVVRVRLDKKATSISLLVAQQLAFWFRARVRQTGGRIKKIMIVALARKLLVALGVTSRMASFRRERR